MLASISIFSGLKSNDFRPATVRECLAYVKNAILFRLQKQFSLSNPLRESHTYPNGDRIQNFTLLLVSRGWKGQPHLNDDETTEVRFMNENDLPPTNQILQHEFSSIALYKEFRLTGRFQWA